MTKTDELEKLLNRDLTEKQAFHEIIRFGEKSNDFPKEQLIDSNLIQGCQSRLYLHHTYKDGKIKFYIHSDALISKGLASLITYIYNDEEPKKLFTHPPTIFQTIPHLSKISMNRQIGISNLFKEMQKISSKYI